MKRLLFVLSCSTALALGCGTADRGDPDDCAHPMSQGLSQPCCSAHGVDACGAGLFCGAFDGRTQATCYPERSRSDQTACTEDRQCMSGSCNAQVGLCRSASAADCSPSVGCAPGPRGAYACDTTGTPACRAAGNACTSSTSDCDQGRECVTCGSANTFCANASDARECLVACGNPERPAWRPSCP